MKIPVIQTNKYQIKKYKYYCYTNKLFHKEHM